MINVKVESELKRKAQKVAAELGLPLGTIINNYLRTFIVEQQVVFEKPLVPNKATAKILDRALADIKKNKNLVSFKDNEEMDRYLMSL